MTNLDITLSDIGLFVLLAEERNFSRAAQAANLTQPTLSRRISQMENALGMRLFDRGSRPVALTVEGRALCLAWKPLLGQIEHGVQLARISGRDRRNAISIGSPDSANEVVSLPAIARSVFAGRPDMDVAMHYLSMSAWRSRVLSGEIDVFLSSLFETCDLPPSFEWEQITVCSKDVVMLRSNPLARQDAIRFDDLRGQRFIMNSPEESPAYCRFVNQMCEAYGGFTPMVARYVSHANNLVASIRKDNEVVVCDMFLRDVENPMVRRYPLPEVKSGLIAVWQRNNPNPNIRPFLLALRRHYADAGYCIADTM